LNKSTILKDSAVSPVMEIVSKTIGTISEWFGKWSYINNYSNQERKFTSNLWGY